jgi:hypothetical protein
MSLVLCAIILMSGTVIMPIITEASYAATSFSFLPTYSNTLHSDLHFVSHKEKNPDPPLTAPAVASPVSSSSPNNMQITAGKVQPISFTINTNNAVGGPSWFHQY